MNLAELERKLFAAARAHPPGDKVPYAFEKRIMARLSTRTLPDFWSVWGGALWRAAAPCVALTIALGAWTYFSIGTSQAGDWSQDFENAVLAAADQDSHVETGW
jgi:hypothetical protein